MNNTHPYFSIIILYWNSNHTISSCLQALESQTFKDFEILLVDNGSTEPISEELISQYPNLPIHFHRLGDNLGFAGGNNYAATQASGQFIVLLNSDAFPKADWLENINLGIHKYPNCFFSSKLIMADDPVRMDGMGDVFHISGLVWRKAHNTLISKHKDKEIEVFSACAAAAIYPLNAFRLVNGFDNDYFSYSEDVDLAFRLRLIGYRCIYLPNAVVSHIGSGSTSHRSDFSVYYGQRNLVWTFYKDMPGIFVWLLTPFHLLANLFMIFLGIFRKQGGVTIQAKWDALLKLPEIINKRKQIQKTRTVSILRIVQAMDWNPLSPFIKLLHRI